MVLVTSIIFFLTLVYLVVTLVSVIDAVYIASALDIGTKGEDDQVVWYGVIQVRPVLILFVIGRHGLRLRRL